MLSKDLLRYSLKEGHFKPFLLSSQPKWLAKAKEILDLYQNSIGLSQEELTESCLKHSSSVGINTKIIRGFIHLLDKKVELHEVNEEGYQEHRQACFEKSKSLFQGDHELTFKHFSEELKSLSLCPDYPSLYGDLAHKRRIKSVPQWQSITLIHRYNLALCQGLIQNAQWVHLSITKITAKKLSYLIRYLNFFGLLFRCQEQKGYAVSLKIEGHLTLFDAPKKYQKRIAALVGILPQLDDFHLKAELLIDQKKALFQLEPEQGLRSHFQAFSDYIPDEIKLFAQNMTEAMNNMGFEPTPAPEQTGPVSDWVIPDFCWQKDSQKVYVEIFQNNQASMLQKRLRQKPWKKEESFLLIEKALFKKMNLEENIHLMSYSSIPSTQKLLKALKNS
ncbi:MAG: DUF790 family protein [Planctomycetes bacterium]|nr:DUF790 family protein [Planctomycetota bacterium]